MSTISAMVNTEGSMLVQIQPGIAFWWRKGERTPLINSKKIIRQGSYRWFI